MSEPRCKLCNDTGEQRYWEGRWRDEKAENERLRAMLASGCCSATVPCEHQRRDPTTICDTCKRAAEVCIFPDCHCHNDRAKCPHSNL